MRSHFLVKRIKFETQTSSVDAPPNSNWGAASLPSVGSLNQENNKIKDGEL
jgi:hypothetical protein